MGWVVGDPRLDKYKIYVMDGEYLLAGGSVRSTAKAPPSPASSIEARDFLAKSSYLEAAAFLEGLLTDNPSARVWFIGVIQNDETSIQHPGGCRIDTTRI